MKLLLDTHTFIWWDSAPNKLSAEILTLFQDQNNEMILSVVSLWEMQIKLQLGKLQFYAPLKDIITAQQETNNIRILVAQAMVEDAILVSRDKIFKQYPVQLLW